MYIRGLHIDGFGIFHDVGIDDVPHGLTVFVGDNESGKSTLMEFLRSVLFGNPSGRKSNKYLPLRGGRHGGRVQVVLCDGRTLTVDRVEKQVTIAGEDSPPEPVEPAQRLFGGIERKTFERVFAVGLTDLQGTEVMDEEAVRSRLASAGTGLGAASVPAAVKKLDGEIDGLLKHRGRSQEIFTLQAALRTVRAELADLGKQAAAYARCQDLRADLQKRVLGGTVRLREIRQRLARMDQLDDAREHWMRLGKERERAKSLEYAREFPPSGRNRFDSLGREIEDLVGLEETKRDELRHLDDELDQIVVDEAVLAQQREIEELNGQRAALASSLTDRPLRQSERDHLYEDYENRLRELGTDWDADRLAQVDTSVQTRQQVRQMADQLGKAEAATAAAHAQLGPRQTDANDARRAVEEASRRFESLPRPPIVESQVLASRQQTVRIIRPLLHEGEMLRLSLADKGAARRDAEQQLAGIERQLGLRVPLLPAWAPLLAGAVGLVLAVVAAIQQTYVPAAGMLLAGITVTVLLYVLRRRQQRSEATRAQALREQKEWLQEKCRDLDAQIQDLQGRYENSTLELQKAADQAGFDAPSDLTALERIAGELDSWATQLQTWMTRKKEMDTAEEHLCETDKQLRQAEQKERSAREEFDRLCGQWQSWLGQRGFTASTRADQFGLVLEAVETARRAQRSYEGACRRVEQIEDHISRIRSRIGDVFRQCGKSPVPTEADIEEIDALARALAEARERHENRRRLVDLRTAYEAELKRIERQLAAKQESRSALMQAANARTEDEFLHAADAHRQWQQCKQTVDGEELSLRTIAGSPEVLSELEKELAQTNPAQLAQERGELQTQLATIEADLSADQQAIGSVDEQLRRMAHDQRLSQRLLEQRNLEEELADAIRRWSVRVVCRSLLEQARQVYEDVRQPKVIQQAANFLGTMTNGRYRLISLLGERGVQLEDRTCERKEEGVWSSGLADQAYLAIRLGLAREFGCHAEPLPVVLDDILVRFDLQRRQAACKVLLQFAAHQQVLLFSCRENLARVIEETRQDDRLSKIPVAYFDVVDGTLTRRDGTEEP